MDRIEWYDIVLYLTDRRTLNGVNYLPILMPGQYQYRHLLSQKPISIRLCCAFVIMCCIDCC